MKFALTQMDIFWENPTENQIICKRLTKQASNAGCDWIIFPEMTLTGFTMQPENFHEDVNHAPTKTFFQTLSRECNINIAFGYIALNDRKNYNHLVFVEMGEVIFEYAKIHPFSYGAESEHYTGGNQVMTVSLSESGICLSGFICYDLRFPEVFQQASKEATIILVIANWPTARLSHWYALLQARAIENQSFILGVNRTGEGGGLQYAPSSVAFGPYGERLTPETTEELLYVDIQSELAKQYRAEFSLKKDRREDLY